MSFVLLLIHFLYLVTPSRSKDHFGYLVESARVGSMLREAYLHDEKCSQMPLPDIGDHRSFYGVGMSNLQYHSGWGTNLTAHS